MDESRIDEIRAEAKANRRAMPLLSVEYKSACIGSRIVDEVLQSDFEHILCYYPIDHEVNLLDCYSIWLINKKIIYFPVTEGDEITFYRLKHFYHLAEGKFGIMEPTKRIHKFENFENSLCLVPGIAFDREGNRIGHGCGYYDRFLSKNPNLVTWGICYKEQLYDEIPAKETDVKMQRMITDEMV